MTAYLINANIVGNVLPQLRILEEPLELVLYGFILLHIRVNLGLLLPAHHDRRSGSFIHMLCYRIFHTDSSNCFFMFSRLSSLALNVLCSFSMILSISFTRFSLACSTGKSNSTSTSPR